MYLLLLESILFNVIYLPVIVIPSSQSICPQSFDLHATTHISHPHKSTNPHNPAHSYTKHLLIISILFILTFSIAHAPLQCPGQSQLCPPSLATSLLPSPSKLLWKASKLPAVQFAPFFPGTASLPVNAIYNTSGSSWLDPVSVPAFMSVP